MTGIIIRIHSDDVTLQSRYGSGVRVMRVPEGGRGCNLGAGAERGRI